MASSQRASDIQQMWACSIMTTTQDLTLHSPHTPSSVELNEFPSRLHLSVENPTLSISSTAHNAEIMAPQLEFAISSVFQQIPEVEVYLDEQYLRSSFRTECKKMDLHSHPVSQEILRLLYMVLALAMTHQCTGHSFNDRSQGNQTLW